MTAGADGDGPALRRRRLRGSRLQRAGIFATAQTGFHVRSAERRHDQAGPRPRLMDSSACWSVVRMMLLDGWRHLERQPEQDRAGAVLETAGGGEGIEQADVMARLEEHRVEVEWPQIVPRQVQADARTT